MTHMAFFCNGCRYRVEAYPDWTASRVKQALFDGGLNSSRVGAKNYGIDSWDDIEIIYAGQQIENEKPMEDYNVCVTIKIPMK